MSYQEPGVYLYVNKTGAVSVSVAAGRIPLLIGTGPSILSKTITMVRAAGQVDAIPASVTAITQIGDTSTVNSYTSGATSDYVFNIATPTVLTWNTGKGPIVGATYYITVNYSVDSTTQYEPVLCSSSSDIDTYFGPDIMVDDATKINRLSEAARIVLENGASQVYVLQVKPSVLGGTATASDYQNALDAHAAFLTDIWRIVPTDSSQSINSVIDGHVAKMSSSDERMERTEIYGSAVSTTLSVAADVITNVGGYATSKANCRLNVIYPDHATRQLSDGKMYILDAPFICAAIAGKESTLKPQESRTRMSISGFNTLNGVKLRRSEMNSLAACGVMILTQTVSGANIVIRHQLSTDMSSVQNREISITDIQDTVSKTLRSVCEPYIGHFNITPDVIVRISGTISSAFTTLSTAGTILTGVINTLLQDATNSDSLLVSVKISVPYPCNYINFTVDLG